MNKVLFAVKVLELYCNCVYTSNKQKQEMYA